MYMDSIQYLSMYFKPDPKLVKWDKHTQACFFLCGDVFSKCFFRPGHHIIVCQKSEENCSHETADMCKIWVCVYKTAGRIIPAFRNV